MRMRVAVCQLNARDDRAANLVAAGELLKKAAAAGADLAVLPEYVDYLGPAAGVPKPEPVDGEFAAFFATTARALGMWVLAGSFHETGPDPERTYNTSLVFDRDGELAASYRKIHLYDVEIPGRVSYQESRSVAPGTESVVVNVEGVPVGLSICYDLRFPSCTGAWRSTARRCWSCRPRSCCTPGGITGRCSCAPGRSKTSATWWPPARSATTTPAARASAAAW
ncbi:hypothetical protein Prum_056390 [Phytohabitans rumicis]|uniref:CN hydrolase domain-containing protein n=1 Tax=Phytohabitans rumicis TaxID=1076125 RepID=A0A6V8LDA1_9ACTN|nr:hypothetical protein Prum_056390 [Phytohabitans rumicis]